MAVALNCCGPLRLRENVRPETEENPACGVGDGGEGGVAGSPLALSLSSPDLPSALSVAVFMALFVTLLVPGPPFNLDGTMIGKLPTVDGDFNVAAVREVKFEDAVLLGEAAFETSAAILDDWPNMSAAATVRNSADAGSSNRPRRNLLIL